MREFHDTFQWLQAIWQRTRRKGVIPMDTNEVNEVTNSLGVRIILHSRNGAFAPGNISDKVWREEIFRAGNSFPEDARDPVVLQMKGRFDDAAISYISGRVGWQISPIKCASLSEETLTMLYNAGVGPMNLIRCGGNYFGLKSNLPLGATVSFAFLKNLGLTLLVRVEIARAHRKGYRVCIPVKYTRVGAMVGAIKKYGLRADDWLMVDTK